VSDFIKKFKDENSEIEKSCKELPKQMEQILKFVDVCVSAFFCYFNYGKSATEKMLPYVRPAVENIIFKKLSDVLFDLYSEKFAEENAKFKSSQINIRKQISNDQIMEYLEINNKFRVKEHLPIKGIGESLEKVCFKTTIDYFNKIEFEHTPKDKFETLMRANLELRNEVLDITRGKVCLAIYIFYLYLFKYMIISIHINLFFPFFLFVLFYNI